MKEYKCPHCGEKIKKGANTCPACEKEIFWMPVASEDSEVKTIKSRVYIRTGSTMSRAGMDKKISEKLFTQMFEVIAKLWKINHFVDNGLEGYEASLEILQNSQVKAIPKAKVSTAKTATMAAKESIAKAPITNTAPPTEYDKIVAQQMSQQPKHEYHRPEPKPEFLEFQERLRQSTMNMPTQVNNNNGDFTQNIF